MKYFILSLFFPGYIFSCEKCIQEIANKNKEILEQLTHYESHMSPSNAYLFYYYAGRNESFSECMRIIKKNHQQTINPENSQNIIVPPAAALPLNPDPLDEPETIAVT